MDFLSTLLKASSQIIWHVARVKCVRFVSWKLSWLTPSGRCNEVTLFNLQILLSRRRNVPYTFWVRGDLVWPPISFSAGPFDAGRWLHSCLVTECIWRLYLSVYVVCFSSNYWLHQYLSENYYFPYENKN